MAIKTKGIDVSHHQGSIDWGKVSQTQEFAMIRIGYSHYNGGLTIDNQFHNNMKGAISHGIPVGVYVYSYDKSANAAAISAKAVIDEIEKSGYQLTYPVVFDIEDAVHTALSKEVNTNMVKAFCSAVESRGYYAMYYTYKSFVTDYLYGAQLANYDFWVAHLTETIDYSNTAGMHQYSWTGRISGINGDVDCNYAFRDYPSIIESAGLNGFDPDFNLEDKEDELECKCNECKDNEEKLNTLKESLKVIKQMLQNATDFIDETLENF